MVTKSRHLLGPLSQDADPAVRQRTSSSLKRKDRLEERHVASTQNQISKPNKQNPPKPQSHTAFFLSNQLARYQGFSIRFSTCPLAKPNNGLCLLLTNVHINWPFKCHWWQLGSQLSSGFCQGLISLWIRPASKYQPTGPQSQGHIG